MNVRVYELNTQHFLSCLHNEFQLIKSALCKDTISSGWGCFIRVDRDGTYKPIIAIWQLVFYSAILV